MTATGFRRLALALPEAIESAHMDHPDFRVGKKIFATLFTRDDQDWGMVKLTPAQQGEYIKSSPRAFQPAAGAWGRRGATLVRLAVVDRETLRSALFTAWSNTAPKRLLDHPRP